MRTQTTTQTTTRTHTTPRVVHHKYKTPYYSPTINKDIYEEFDLYVANKFISTYYTNPAPSVKPRVKYHR